MSIIMRDRKKNKASDFEIGDRVAYVEEKTNMRFPGIITGLCSGGTAVFILFNGQKLSTICEITEIQHTL